MLIWQNTNVLVHASREERVRLQERRGRDMLGPDNYDSYSLVIHVSEDVLLQRLSCHLELFDGKLQFGPSRETVFASLLLGKSTCLYSRI